MKTASVKNPVPWVIVTSPGMDNEYFWNDYATFKEANRNLKEAEESTGEECQIMKRLDDGRLTAEY